MENVQWKYMGEGGKNAVFCPAGSGSKEYDSCLLRVRKQDLVDNAQYESSEDRFHAIFKRTFPDHVDLPVAVSLSSEFLESLRKQAIGSGSIPGRRRNDWENAGKPSLSNTGCRLGFVVKDYRLSLGKTGAFSCELKPKAGYTAFSPLVSPNRRCKYLHPRYSLLQQLCDMGKLKKRWMADGEKFRPSDYNPLDLFSGQLDRIRRALGSLRDSPQNNFRAWEGPLSLSSGPCGGKAVDDVMLDIVATVLYKESILSDLLSLQKLDILDADGAIAVYNRLVYLCDGSFDDAEQLVDMPCKTAAWKKAPHCLLDASLFSPPPETTATCSLCDEIETFSHILETSRPHLPDDAILDQSREACLDSVGQLTCCECCYLLRLWLLSLTACDVSLFLTFRPVSNDAGETPHQPHEDSVAFAPNGRGVVCVPSSSKQWLYQVKIIDFDQKPCRKLRDRISREELLNAL